ncbi:hypothetical protein [Brevundimonas sp.]|uniref:hypothetical protein n=1 Tax=Brevundimonas sp. TaxID=1871086 RepID=UPI003F6EB9A3
MLKLLSSLAVVLAVAVMSGFGFFFLRREQVPLADSVAAHELSRGELALAWGITAAPLGFVVLVGDRGVGHPWARPLAICLLAAGLLCAVLRRLVYRRWR